MKGTSSLEEDAVRPTETCDPRPGFELIQILNTGTDSYTVDAPGQVGLNNPCCPLPALCTGGSILLSGPPAVVRGAQSRTTGFVFSDRGRLEQSRSPENESALGARDPKPCPCLCCSWCCGCT